MDDILAVTISNVYDTQKMKYLLDSANMHDFAIETIGLNKPFTFLSKITCLKEYLANLSENSNPIVCFTDAYDVFYSDSLETIKQKFLSHNVDIVWSVERWYSHQLKNDLDFYENLPNITTPYKYINTGKFIGYKNSLLRLLNDIEISINNKTFLDELGCEGWNLDSPAVDQTIISHHIAKYWNNNYNIKFDYNCEIFYIPCGDWDNIDRYVDTNLFNSITKNRPSVIHVPWKSRYEHILIELFYRGYKSLAISILDNRKYSWNYDSYIIFLKNRRLDGCGGFGDYTFQGENTILAYFAGIMHKIVFNNNFTEFTSTRCDNNKIVKGKLL